jgi:hypothetical protein
MGCALDILTGIEKCELQLDIATLMWQHCSRQFLGGRPDMGKVTDESIGLPKRCGDAFLCPHTDEDRAIFACMGNAWFRMQVADIVDAQRIRRTMAYIRSEP